MLSRIRGAAPVLVALAAAIAAGAAVAVDPRFLAVEALLLLVLASLFYPGTWWQLAPLAILVVSPSIFVDSVGNPLPNGDAAQKALLIVVLLCLLITAGGRWSTIGGAAVATIGIAFVVSALDIGGAIDVEMGTAARAFIGYALPWTFLFVNWRRIGVARGLTFLAQLPLWCLVAGLLLQFAGITTVLRVEDTGVPRLQGASLPAHLAMLALIGLTASLCLLASAHAPRGPQTFLWAGLNLVVLIGTATRGALVVGCLVTLAFVAQSLLRKRSVTRRAKRAAWLVTGVGGAAMVFAAPELIRRSMGNSYEGTFNTSGRDQAWEFFYGLASQSPVTGRGLGFATVAVQMFAPPHVQKQFVAPHNEYIHLVLDGGVFFALGLLAAMMALFYRAARAQRGTTRWTVAAFAVGVLFYSAIDNTFSTPQFTVLVVMLLGLLAAHPAPDAAAPPAAIDHTRVPVPAGGGRS